MLATTGREQTPLTRQLNTLTLWIAAAAGITMVVMFVLGAQRGESATVVFTSAVALAIAAIPRRCRRCCRSSCRSAPPIWPSTERS